MLFLGGPDCVSTDVGFPRYTLNDGEEVFGRAQAGGVKGESNGTPVLYVESLSDLPDVIAQHVVEGATMASNARPMPSRRS